MLSLMVRAASSQQLLARLVPLTSWPLRQCVTRHESLLPNPTAQPQVVKVAVVGVPNSGKSTLINQLLNRRTRSPEATAAAAARTGADRLFHAISSLAQAAASSTTLLSEICATSSKVHTTRHQVKAVSINGDTQLVFMDTPGLVSQAECKKHELEPSFLKDPPQSLSKSDVVLVVHDLSCKWTRHQLHHNVLQLISSTSRSQQVVLVLNKVDKLKSKRVLLDLVEKLTTGTLSSSSQLPLDMPINATEPQSKNTVGGGFPHFSEVFMVSALTGSGVGDVKEYLLSQAQPGTWLFPADTYTDQSPRELAEQAVREKLLEHLPKEVPYNIRTNLEMWEQTPSGMLCIVVLAECKAKRYQKILLGHGGKRIRLIAGEAEQALSNTLRCAVRLKIVVTDNQGI